MEKFFLGDFNKGYRTLTVDKATYDLLEKICKWERRKKIDQLRLLIEKSYSNVSSDAEKNVSTFLNSHQAYADFCNTKIQEIVNNGRE